MIILASASPRRREIMNMLFGDFRVMPSNVDETIPVGIEPREIPLSLARRKAEHILGCAEPGDIVIGCDTGVFVGERMLGKPSGKQDAFEMLKALSGRTHTVVTGCAILSKSKESVFSQATQVEFYPLTDEQINAYIETGEPFDKAGAYGIQGKGALLVKQISGDYLNVVGLPAARLKRELIALEGKRAEDLFKF